MLRAGTVGVPQTPRGERYAVLAVDEAVPYMPDTPTAADRAGLPDAHEPRLDDPCNDGSLSHWFDDGICAHCGVGELELGPDPAIIAELPGT